MSAVLKVENLNVTLTYRKASKKLVEDVSFEVHPGECLGILGESGSGKSMTVKSILGLLDKNFQVSGSAVFDGHDLLKESKEELRRLRGSRITMVLQNPMTCFDPLYRIGNQMAETFAAHTAWNAQEIRTCCLKILDQMQILNGEEVLEKYPHQLSGGMLQRIMIGIAMALQPELLIADEPTTAIDAVTQYEILEEFVRIKKNKNTAMLFITHDLGAMAQICHSVRVMYLGNLVEEAQAEALFARPLHPYTQGLLDCIPRLDSDRSQPLHVISGVVPPLSNVPEGCRFCTRCPYADQRCMLQNPPSVEVYPGHKAKCWKYVTEQEVM